jgi:hypothetical protein
VGDGLYSGGSLEFKIKRVSPFFFSFFFYPLFGSAVARDATVPRALRYKRGPERRGADGEHAAAQQTRVAS